MISLKHIQTEIDASYLYNILALNEPDKNVAKVFFEMSEIEASHATTFLIKNNMAVSPLPMPSFRAKMLKKIGSIFGNDLILGVLLDTEKGIASAVQQARLKNNSNAKIGDTAHVAILQNILNNHKHLGSNTLARFEKRHRSVGGNALRAAVLGGNDGLVSNFSLVMGIAGASSGQKEVLITGIAGLLAGALSMALGEWLSVKSAQELYENQIQLELDELENNPEGEEKELALIYFAKGIDEVQAQQMAKAVMLDTDKAHQILIKEELGISTEDLKGSAMEAAISSFVLFAIGAIIPVIPFFFLGGLKAVIISAFLSAIGLFAIGSAITLFTGKSIAFSGFRQVVFGLLAAAITYVIGSIIGVSLTP
jgi:VIT1/CCC1 family predicted Fe2+/Mn2+ transporter